MPISIVVGGQFGSEGKGKVAHYLAGDSNVVLGVRVGGANSGHTVVVNGQRYILRHLPTPVMHGHVAAVIPAGTYLDVDVLLKEIELLGLEHNRVLIHPRAMVVDSWMRDMESSNQLTERLGSTAQGVGVAVAQRALRRDVTFAADAPALRQFVRSDIPEVMNTILARRQRIVVEGTQGFGLSLLHGPHYPYCTSRDTTAAAALSEAGLPLTEVDCVALVLRAFPIRVAGQSGPLARETSWKAVTERAGAIAPLVEHTTVTGRERRVAHFDSEVPRAAIRANKPTLLCLNHADYFDYSVHERRKLTPRAEIEIRRIESELGHPIGLIGTGPSVLLNRSTLRDTSNQVA